MLSIRKLFSQLIRWKSLQHASNELLISFYPVWILERASYRESTKSYPIDSRSELNKVLALKSTGEVSRTLSEVLPQKESGFTVKDYIFDASEVNKEPNRPLFCIPESLLVSSTLAENTVAEVESGGTTYFLLNRAGGHISALKQGNINSIERFAAANAIPSNMLIDVKKVNVVNLAFNAKTLLSIALKLKWCRIPFSDARVKSWIYNPMMVVTLLMCGYLAVSSAYVFYLEKSIKSEFSANQSQLRETLNITRKLDDSKRVFEDSSELASSFFHSGVIWYVLAPLIQQEISLKTIETSQEYFIINGEHESASQVLAIIQSIDGVVEAGFDSPVVSRRNNEIFTIRIKVNDKAIIEVLNVAEKINES